MVTYGPWQEPAEYTETWKFGSINTTKFGRTTYTITPARYDPDGGSQYPWQGAGGMRPNMVGRASGYALETRLFVPGNPPFRDEYMEPGYGTDQPSQEAWANALSEDVGAQTSGTGEIAGPISIEYEGGILPTAPLGDQHSEQWIVETFEAMPEFHVRTGSTNWNALAGIPDEEPPGAIYAEIDPERSTSALLSKAVSLSLAFSLNADSRWHLFVKDFGPGSSGWLLSGDHYAPMYSGPAGTDLGSAGEHEFDVSLIEEWKVAAGTGAGFVPKSLLPQIGVVWTGGWPGNFLGSGPPTYPVTNPDITLTYRWQGPRWRWVYDELPVEPAVPYRRVFPRDDALTGGARRTFPPSRAVQSSNRIGGGYL